MHWDTAGFPHTSVGLPMRKISPDRAPLEPFPTAISQQRGEKKLSRARLAPGRFHTSPVMSFDEIIVESEEENFADSPPPLPPQLVFNNNIQPAATNPSPPPTPNLHILSVDSVTRHHGHHGPLVRHRSSENLSHAKLGLNLPPIPEEWRNSTGGPNSPTPSGSRTKILSEANNNHLSAAATTATTGDTNMIR